jgi:3',5'-cyclic-AMP phosphodiesterase
MLLSRRDFMQLSGAALLAACQRPTNQSAKTLRFAVASDGHYGQPKTEYDLYFDNIVENLRRERDEKGLDFVVFNGDLFHDDAKFLPDVAAKFQGLGMTHYVTRGNHDHVTEAQWRQTWGYGLNQTVELGKSAALLLVDTSNEKGEYLCPDFGWIDGELAKLTRKQHVFLFAHIPSKQWSPHGTTCAEWETVLGKYPNLKATFHGHDHAVEDGKKGAKPAFFDGHFGGNWGVGYRGYRIVETRPDGSCYTYQFNPDTQTKVNEQVF